MDEEKLKRLMWVGKAEVRDARKGRGCPSAYQSLGVSKFMNELQTDRGINYGHTLVDTNYFEGSVYSSTLEKLLCRRWLFKASKLHSVNGRLT